MLKQLASEISFFRIEEHWMLWLRGGAGGQGGSRFTLWSICSLMSIAWTPNHLNVSFMRVEFPNDTSNLIVFKRFFIIYQSIYKAYKENISFDTKGHVSPLVEMSFGQLHHMSPSVEVSFGQLRQPFILKRWLSCKKPGDNFWNTQLWKWVLTNNR